MYPLGEGATWVRETWYAAGFADEFGREPIERTILGERVLLFRSDAGMPIVLSGVCPHRFMPLVLGRRDGDTIECAYHGMTFNKDGRCLAGPAGSPPAGRLRRYPALEVGPLVWIWTGAAERADPALLPDVSQCGIATAGWRADPNGVTRIGARYLLIVDNLFDLSHINWVHASVLGKLSIADQKPSVRDDGGLLNFERREVGEPDAFIRFLFPHVAGPVENVLATKMLGPGLITSRGPAITEAEDSPKAGSVLGELHFVHVITPETEHSTLILTVITRNFRQEDDELSAAIRRQNDVFLQQDVATAEAIEAVLASGLNGDELTFKSDWGGIEARRIIRALIDQEQVQAAIAG